MFFAYRSFYTQAPLCTGACRQNNLHTEMLLHKETLPAKTQCRQAFLYMNFDLHTGVFICTEISAHKRLYTHTHVPLDTHTQTHTHRHTHTNTHTHLCVYRQKLLHTGASAQKLLHTEAITHRCYFTHQLLRFACAHKRFNRQKTLIHTCVLTHRSDATACAHSRLYTQKVPTQVPHMRIAHVPHDFEDRRCFRARGAHSVK